MPRGAEQLPAVVHELFASAAGAAGTVPAMPTHRLSWLLALAALAAAPTAAQAAVAEVTPLRESAPLFEDEGNDADDPAIWVNPLLRDRSVIVATKKDAGLTAFTLTGRTLQDIPAPGRPAPGAAKGRFNNVDIVYGARVGGSARDLAIVTDRGWDRIRTFVIDPVAASLGRPPLREISAATLPFVFNATQREVDEQATAYGVAAWVDPRTRTPYVVTSRRARARLALLRLVAAPGGGVTYETAGGARTSARSRSSTARAPTACRSPTAPPSSTCRSAGPSRAACSSPTTATTRRAPTGTRRTSS